MSETKTNETNGTEEKIAESMRNLMEQEPRMDPEIAHKYAEDMAEDYAQIRAESGASQERR